MRAAFEESFSRMDFRVIRAAMNDALSSVSGWKTSAMDAARQVTQERRSNQEVDELETSEEVSAGAKKIEAVFNRPETLNLFAAFDERFDSAFKPR